MNEKKKAAPAAATAESGNGQILFRGFKPKKDIITDFEPAQGTIASILNHGKENGITCRDIADITGLPFRTVTLRIYAERREGAPIMSDNRHGFWLAEDEAEVEQCSKALHARAAKIHETANALERWRR